MAVPHPFNMTSLLLLLALLAGHHVKPAPVDWVAYNASAHSIASTTPIAGDIATVAIPAGSLGSGQLAFITTTRVASLLGDLTGSTITAQFSIITTGNPQFTYWGEGSNWNLGNRPVSVRLVFMTRTGFSTSWADEVWYSNPASIDLAQVMPQGYISATLDPTLWSNGQGQLGSDRVSQFNSAVANVQQVGLAFGGGSFFDVGVDVVRNTGTATFHLNSYED